MTKFPADLKYTKDHEWAKIEGNQITIGITDHAQKSLGDIVYVELPEIGRQLKTGDPFGVVESIKAVSDLYAPISGKVVKANTSVTEDPSQINQDPYRAGWIIKIEATNPSQELSELMDATRYEKYVQSL